MCRHVGLQQTQQAGEKIIGNFQISFFGNLKTVIPFPQRRGLIAAPPSQKQLALAKEMGPRKLPGGSSEVAGRTFERFFRQIRSNEFVGGTLKVSSGELVGSPGDLGGDLRGDLGV